MSSDSAANTDDRLGAGRLFSGWWRATGRRELGQLLYWVWDPIGVNAEFPVTVNEYDGYALEIATALAADLDRSAITALLSSIEGNRMGLAPRDLDAITERLLAWYRRSVERFDDQAGTGS